MESCSGPMPKASVYMSPHSARPSVRDGLSIAQSGSYLLDEMLAFLVLFAEIFRYFHTARVIRATTPTKENLCDAI
jgi:hypothetical protein